MTVIINLHAGPGSGKSTSAAIMYAYLKQAGINAELVREYVKDWAWDERKVGRYDQFYLMGKQIRRESMLYGKTQIIVTDSPVLLGAYYADRYAPPQVADGVRKCIEAFYSQAQIDGHHHRHVFLRRSKAYQPAGRYETEEQAREIDVGIKTMLTDMGLGFEYSHTDSASLEELLRDVLTEFRYLQSPTQSSDLAPPGPGKPILV